MKKFGFLVLMCVISLTSCNVYERITFDEGMGGTFESSFDMSPMLQMAGATGAASERKPEKIDTLIVFNEYLEQFKDSIATLSQEKQAELMQLKNMRMRMVMDDEKEIMTLTTSKTFTNFQEVATVSNQMDQVFNFAKLQGPSEQTAGPSGDMLKQDKVRYTLVKNVFRRVDQKVFEKEEAIKNNEEIIEEELSVEDQQSENMMKGMMSQFEEMLAASKLTLEYSFPKKIKSVSKSGAVISENGKTVIYTIDWKTLMDDETLMENFEVILEE